jgi:hypothetical protein
MIKLKVAKQGYRFVCASVKTVQGFLKVFSKDAKTESTLICSRAHRRGLKNLLNRISSADLRV